MFNDVLLEFVLLYVVFLGRRLVCVKVMQMLLIEIWHYAFFICMVRLHCNEMEACTYMCVLGQNTRRKIVFCNLFKVLYATEKWLPGTFSSQFSFINCHVGIGTWLENLLPNIAITCWWSKHEIACWNPVENELGFGKRKSLKEISKNTYDTTIIFLTRRVNQLVTYLRLRLTPHFPLHVVIHFI
jgi:hypothetical protein